MTSTSGFETFGPYAVAVANKYGLPPDVFLNQINQESGFNQYGSNGNILTSSKGALGISQILPTTAASPGYGIGSVDPTDPYASIDFMGAYDAAMLKRTGTVTGMLEGYNAGLGHLSAGSPYAQSVLAGPFSGGVGGAGTSPGAPASAPSSNGILGDFWPNLVNGSNAIISAITGQTTGGITPDQGKAAIAKTTGTDKIGSSIDTLTTKLFGAQTWQGVAIAILGIVLILGALFWLASSGKATQYIQAAKTGGALA